MSDEWRLGLGAVVLVGGVAVALVAARFLTRTRAFRRAPISLRVLLLVAVLLATMTVTAPLLGATTRPALGATTNGYGTVWKVLHAIGVLMAVIVAVRVAEALLIYGWFGVEAERAVGTLARQIIFLIIVLVTTLILLDVYFKTPPSALLASSVVISAVVVLSLVGVVGLASVPAAASEGPPPLETATPNGAIRSATYPNVFNSSHRPSTKHIIFNRSRCIF